MRATAAAPASWRASRCRQVPSRPAPPIAPSSSVRPKKWRREQDEEAQNLSAAVPDHAGPAGRGGRGVLHDKELTYSVIVPESHPNMPSTVTEAYRVISQGLLEGFKNLGFDTYFAVPKTPEERQKLKQPRSSVCFDAPSWYELVVEGRKIAGSAQTRQKGVILQHGSILQDIDIDELFDMFIYKNERLKLKMKEAFVEKAVAINDISDEHITISQMEEAFEKGFKKGLNIELKPLELTEVQLAEVEELTEKYRSDEWMFRK